MTRRRLISAGAVVLVISAALGWLVLYSSALGVNTIEVRGAQVLSTATVTDVLAIQPGTPLARVDLAAAEASLENVTQIESASVSRDWPGTLVVQLIERSPIAAVDVNGTTWLLDRFGVLFAQVSALPQGIVVLQVERPGPDDRATSAGIEVIQALAPAIRSILVRIRAPSLTQIELELTDGRTVLWGDADNSVRKSQILAGLLAGGVVGTAYDVSSPTSAVVR
ncbi:MAG: FtsQ-type POTRA domain-containing protein [Geodermatophilaceae bacterium]|nr:FtsQ-type POTRA domain-containing protein [Geodermatophilaceae bacterium]